MMSPEHAEVVENLVFVGMGLSLGTIFGFVMCALMGVASRDDREQAAFTAGTHYGRRLQARAIEVAIEEVTR